jgi:hypothetical protein
MKMYITEGLRSCGGGESANRERAQSQEWFTTEEAAVYLRTTVKAIIMRVWRGSLVPDCRGQRGRSKKHMFRKATLDSYYRGS